MEVGSLESAFQLWSGRHRASPALLKRRFNQLSALIVQTIYTKRRRELVHTYDMNIDLQCFTTYGNSIAMCFDV